MARVAISLLASKACSALDRKILFLQFPKPNRTKNKQAADRAEAVASGGEPSDRSLTVYIV
jgi:hypothetical protein